MLNNIGTESIQTSRLILRRFTYKDDNDMLKYWVADENIQSLYGEPAYTTKSAVKELLNQYIGRYENRMHYYRWAIALKADNACIGQIAYFLVDDANHFGEIEYCIGSAFQGQGLATEATKAVIAYGFDKVNLHKVQISHKATNAPSKRVIEKCGFKQEGILRDYFHMDGQYVDRVFYSILKHEYAHMMR